MKSMGGEIVDGKTLSNPEMFAIPLGNSGVAPENGAVFENTL